MRRLVPGEKRKMRSRITSQLLNRVDLKSSMTGRGYLSTKKNLENPQRYKSSTEMIISRSTRAGSSPGGGATTVTKSFAAHRVVISVPSPPPQWYLSLNLIIGGAWRAKFAPPSQPSRSTNERPLLNLPLVFCPLKRRRRRHHPGRPGDFEVTAGTLHRGPSFRDGWWVPWS